MLLAAAEASGYNEVADFMRQYKSNVSCQPYIVLVAGMWLIAVYVVNHACGLIQ